MTTSSEPTNTDDADAVERRIDEIARRSGEAFRRPPPEDGAAAAMQRGTRIRRQRLGVGVATACVLGVGAIAVAANRDSDSSTKVVDSVPVPVTTISTPATSAAELPATTTSVVESTIASTTPPAPVTTTNRADIPPIQPASDPGIERIATVESPSQIVTDGVTTWVANDLGQIARFDAQSGQLLGTVEVTKDDHAEQPALAFGSFWITTDTDDSLWRIDAASGEVIATIAIPGNIVGGNQLWNPINLAVGEDTLWVLAQTPEGSIVARVDPATNQVASTLPAASNSTQFIGYGYGSLWELTTGGLLRIDPDTGEEIARVNTGEFPVMLAFGLDSVWCDVLAAGETLVRIDPETNSIIAKVGLPIDTDPWHGNLSFGGGFAWSSSQNALLVKIDPATNEIVARYVEGAAGGATAASNTSVWFSDYETDTVYRLGLT